MEKEIAQLKRKYKTYRKVAEILEITERYIQMIAKGQPISRSLKYRIQQELTKV